MALRFEDLRVRDGQLLDRDFFNRRYRLIVEALTGLGADVGRLDATTDNLMSLGLERVDEALAPALAAAQAAAENGFLVATSATELTLSLDLETTIQVDDTTARALFTPTPQVIVTRQGGALADWAIFEVASYSRENGGLAGCLAGGARLGSHAASWCAPSACLLCWACPGWLGVVVAGSLFGGVLLWPPCSPLSPGLGLARVVGGWLAWPLP